MSLPYELVKPLHGAPFEVFAPVGNRSEHPKVLSVVCIQNPSLRQDSLYSLRTVALYRSLP